MGVRLDSHTSGSSRQRPLPQIIHLHQSLRKDSTMDCLRCLKKLLFFKFFFNSCLTSICNLMVMTDLHSSRLFIFLITPSQLTLFPNLPSPHCLAARAALPGFGLWANCPPSSASYFLSHLLSSNSSPSWSTLSTHCVALSAPLSLCPTSVVIRNLSSGCTACSFASRFATHLLSGRRCHPVPSTSRSLLSTLLSLRHFLHLVY